VLLNGSLSRSTVSFLASATKREKLCAGNPEKSKRSTEVFKDKVAALVTLR
jgi:hypothetical protein